MLGDVHMSAGNTLKGRTKRYPSSIDVARLAGVSQSAVSRTFSHAGGVSPQTREKVHAAAAKLGYRPSVIPRIMQTHRSYLVAIAIGGMYNPFNSQILEQFTSQLQNIGYQVMLVHVEHGATLNSVMPKLASYHVDAIFVARGILSAAAAAKLAEYQIPIVAFHTPICNDWVSAICYDNAEAGRLVAEHFVEQGAQRYGFIRGLPLGTTSTERLAGFAGRLKELNLAPPIVSDAEFTYEGGWQAALDLFARPDRPDALFCANDLIALGVMDSARKMGIDIPGELMVAGFDDIPDAGWAGNDLTTFGAAGESMVDVALNLLQHTAHSDPMFGKIVSIPVSLIARGSTKRS